MELIHDGEIDLALGKSRKEVNWRNRTHLWSWLVERVSVTHRTPETYAEYNNAKTDRKSEIKDIGGYVGGRLTKGRRGKGSVSYRSLLTLDLDFASADFWDEFTLLYGNAACMYSTHAHTAKKPRYRLVMPLDRHVLPDEYEAIARRIAGNVNIDYFDDTTYQPERLMYWPSTSKDGEFVFQHQDGPWLSADEVLKTYHDWTDSSEWPVSDRVGDVLRKAMKKAGDPTEKPGIVGAFCRTYDIHETIAKYLSDVYTPCEDGRYTYAGGTTSAGLVTYEDKWAYSHHGTDPASMQLCNAFDLVRIHLYGLRDEDVREGTPVNRLPSHVAMEELASKDGVVRTLLVGERLASAQADFNTVDPEEPQTADSEEDEQTDWMPLLDTDKKGNLANTVDNVIVLLENAPELKERIVFDEFAHRPMVKRSLPWRKVTQATRNFTDFDLDSLYHHLEKCYGMGTTKLEKALNVYYNRHQVHPVREYLNGVKWDGVPRVDRLLVDYFGASDNTYTHAVTRKTLVGAVSRIFEPGIKFDHVLLLVGEEGKLKSTFFSKLGKDWFTDDFSFSMLKNDNKKAVEQLMGRWIVEVPEMSGFRHTASVEIKGYLSRQVDDCRLAYGVNKTTRPRQNIFVSCSNEETPLQDNHGNRRIWPVRIDVKRPSRSIQTDLTSAEVDQVWAEAVKMYLDGETVYLGRELEALARKEQAEHTEEDEMQGMVEQFLDTKLPDGWRDMDVYSRRAWLQGDELQAAGNAERERVCLTEIWLEVINPDKKSFDWGAQQRLRRIMSRIPGWRKSDKRMYCGKAYGAQYGYEREGVAEVSKSILDSIKITKN